MPSVHGTRTWRFSHRDALKGRALPSDEAALLVNPADTDRRTRIAAIAALLLAMASFQAGATIAKTLIPKIGAPGTAALRVGLGALIVAILQRPWRNMPKSWK